MKKIVRLGVFAALVSLLCGYALSRETGEVPPDSGRSSRLRFEAGETEFRMNEDESVVKRYSNGVRAWTEDRDSELHADKAVYSSAEGETRFYGSAAFRDSARHLDADTLIYFDRNDVVEAEGNVIVTEKDRVFRAARIVYEKRNRLVRAYGGVAVRDDSLRSTIDGVEAVFNDSTKCGLIIGAPVLTKRDEEGSVITVTCDDTLEIIRQERTVRLWSNVVIVKDSMRVVSGSAVYHDSTEVFTLMDKPEAFHTMVETAHDARSDLKADSYITGDTIRVFLKDRKITAVDVLGNAYSATVWKDSTESVFARSIIESSKMSLTMDGDMISMITAEGTAKSYYFRDPADGEKMFVNESSGDTLRFFYEEGKLNHLRISGYGGGGAKGKYFEYMPAKADTAETKQPS